MQLNSDGRKLWEAREENLHVLHYIYIYILHLHVFILQFVRGFNVS